MKHESCLSIDSTIKNEIIKASNEINISASDIAKSLIDKACRINNSIIISGHLVEYQKSVDDSMIVQFRYRLSDEEHKFFSSSRVRLETSVSMLLLVGFLLFFRKFLNKHKKKCKEYSNSYTVIVKKYILLISYFLKKVEFKTETCIKLE